MALPATRTLRARAIEPRPLAGRARVLAHERGQIARQGAVALDPEPGQRTEETGDRRPPAPVEHRLPLLRGKRADGYVAGNAELLLKLALELVQAPFEGGAPLGRFRAQPVHHVRQVQPGVRDDEIGVELFGGAHAVTVRARSLAAVEREQPGVQGLVSDAAGAAEEALVVDLLGALGEHVNHPVAEPQALPQHRLHAQASGLCGAHHDVDVVLVETPESLLEYRRGEGGHGPVDAGAAVAQPAGRHHHVLVIALAPAHHRAQHGDVLAAVLAPHPVQDPAAGERGDGAAALGAVLLAHLGIQQAQVVVELGDGGHGGVPASLAEALLDGHGGRYACQYVDVGPGHDLHELPRVGGEAVDVAPLAVRVDDVEGQGRFPGAAEAGHHHQPVPGDIDGDVLEIVLLGADDPDGRRVVGPSRRGPARAGLGQGGGERGR